MATKPEIVILEQRLEAAMEMKLESVDRFDQALEKLEETVGRVQRTSDRLEVACAKVRGLQEKIQDIKDYSASIVRQKKLNLAKAEAVAAEKAKAPLEEKDLGSSQVGDKTDNVGAVAVPPDTKSVRVDNDTKPRNRRKRGRSKSKRDGSRGGTPVRCLQPESDQGEHQSRFQMPREFKRNSSRGNTPVRSQPLQPDTFPGEHQPRIQMQSEPKRNRSRDNTPVRTKQPEPVQVERQPLFQMQSEFEALTRKKVMEYAAKVNAPLLVQDDPELLSRFQERKQKGDSTQIYIGELGERLARAQSRTMNAENAICFLQMEIGRLGSDLLKGSPEDAANDNK